MGFDQQPTPFSLISHLNATRSVMQEKWLAPCSLADYFGSSNVPVYRPHPCPVPGVIGLPRVIALTLPLPLMPFHLPVPSRNLKLPCVSPAAPEVMVSVMTKSPSGSMNLVYESEVNWPAIVLLTNIQWAVMLSKTLFARLLMVMPLKSPLMTVKSLVEKSIVCVEEPHRVKSNSCSACATGRNKSKLKRIAAPLPHLLISIMLSLLLLYREI